MSSCAVCLKATIKSPVVLPCGHIFCHDCANRAIQSVKPPVQYQCPKCRHPYHIIMVDSVRIPAQLLPHVLPGTSKPNSERLIQNEHAVHRNPADLKAENEKLRTYCAMWRRRAEAHTAATLGILDIAHTARNEALRIKIERDELQTRYNELKRKHEESESMLLPPSLLFANDLDGTNQSPTPSSLIFDDEEENFKTFENRGDSESEPPETPDVATSSSPAPSHKQF